MRERLHIKTFKKKSVYTRCGSKNDAKATWNRRVQDGVCSNAARRLVEQSIRSLEHIQRIGAMAGSELGRVGHCGLCRRSESSAQRRRWHSWGAVATRSQRTETRGGVRLTRERGTRGSDLSIDWTKIGRIACPYARSSVVPRGLNAGCDR
jgi:hypothetical protein